MPANNGNQVVTTGMPAQPFPSGTKTKKYAGGGMRTWLKLDANGDGQVIEADKSAVAHKLAVPLRDLRILDPNISTAPASALLVREKALVVNLEAVKAIITADQVLLLNAEAQDAATLEFVEEMKARLRSGGGGGAPPGGLPGASAAGAEGPEGELPFELRALEVCLEAVCTLLERAYGELESAAHPALDALTVKVNSANLERVRKIKSRITRLTTRVAKVREELERFLDDDSDMRDMYLTRKKDLARAEAEAAAAAPDGPVQQQPGTARMLRPSLRYASQPYSPFAPSLMLNADSSLINALDPYDDSDLEEVEFLLESYFMLVDSTYNKLSTLTEYVDDTEDYINIVLDTRRNQLIQFQLLLTAATLCIGMYTLVTGVFGMNLIPLWLLNNELVFNQVNGFCTMSVFILFVSFIAYARRMGFLDMII